MRRLAGLLLVLAAGTTAAASQYITARTGSVPIVLSVPHDGRLSLLSWPQRTCSGTIVDKSTWGCYKANDTGTRELADEMLPRLEAAAGGTVYLVRNEVHRKWVDMNRPPWGNMAYENDGGRIPYEEYHAALEAACLDVLRRWGRGFLLDLHHTDVKYEPAMAHFNRGSGNGVSTPNLGLEALFGPQSLFGYLRSRGYSVQPATPGEPEKWRLSWIADSHGGHRPNGLDGFILEIKHPFDPSRSAVARDLADALAAFRWAHLPTGATGCGD